MKEHLVILCGVYYPEPSPTGLCARRFASLLSGEYDVEIICLSERGGNETVTGDRGMPVHVLCGRRMAMEHKSRGVAKKLLHLLGGVQIKSSLLGNLKWYRRAAGKKLEQLHRQRPVDAVLSVCSPFAAHCAAMDFKAKHPAVRWCGYTVDPYAVKGRIRPLGMSLEALVRAERRVLSRMDALLLSEEVFESRPELYADARSCARLPYMLPQLPAGQVPGGRFDPRYINCVYAGSFYRDIRNPETMLKTFAQLRDLPVRLHLFSRGCEDIVQKYTGQTDRILVRERVTPDEMAAVYAEADVLVNVDNASAEFMPSKIFEYIVSGKPIVNFYATGRGRQILDAYPLCLQLDNGSAEPGTEALQEFLQSCSRQQLSGEEVVARYRKHAPEEIFKVLMGALRG